jgi:predicted dehydrogenase
MSGEPIRVAVVGLGGIADAHLRKLRWIEDAHVVGVCDLSASLTEAVADRFGVAGAYTDAERMLAETRPHAVHVLTPPQSHPPLASAALASGAHVLVEKPVAVAPDAYAGLREASRAAGRHLVEDLNYRFQRVTLQALEAVRSGAIGRPVALEAAMSVGLASGAYTDPDAPHFAHRLPGGALFNFVSHPASIVAAFLGAHDGVRVARRRLGAASLGDDELTALVTAGGASATITVTSHAQPSSFPVAIRGTEGALAFDVFTQRLRISRRSGRLGRIADDVAGGAAAIGQALAGAGRAFGGRNDYVEGLGTLLDRFYDSLRTGGPPPLDPAEMDASNALVFALVDEANAL